MDTRNPVDGRGSRMVFRWWIFVFSEDMGWLEPQVLAERSSQKAQQTSEATGHWMVGFSWGLSLGHEKMLQIIESLEATKNSSMTK